MARFDGFFRECKMTNAQHDKFALKNKMAALAEQKKPIWEPKEIRKTCTNCGLNHTCKDARIKYTGGAASVGAEEDCARWKPRTERVMDQKKIQSLLKQFKRMKT